MIEVVITLDFEVLVKKIVSSKLLEVCPYRDSSRGNRDPYVGILVPTRDPLP